MQDLAKANRTVTGLGLLLTGTLFVSAAMAQAHVPRHVWVTFYYDASGALVGAHSYGACDLGSWGQQTAHSVEQVYDCDGELPW